MIKMLNENRVLKGLTYMPKWYKTSSDYMKINLQAADISIMLRELKSRLEFSYIRLQHAIRFHKSKQIRSELKFQERILNEHLREIDKLIDENWDLQRKNHEKKYGKSAYDYDSLD
tara:strand:- start:188 stop:535 length:348 start_codon:yes stop_codon:yes gene_type:complete